MERPNFLENLLSNFTINGWFVGLYQMLHKIVQKYRWHTGGTRKSPKLPTTWVNPREKTKKKGKRPFSEVEMSAMSEEKNSLEEQHK